MATVSPAPTGRFAGHYDPDVDIAWLRFEGYDGATAVSSERPWGLEERDPDSGQVVAIEIWGASKTLPEAFLALLPEPGAAGQIDRLEQSVNDSISWLRDHYWDPPFRLERDIVCILQNRLTESLSEAGVHAQVVPNFSVSDGQVDLAILAEGVPLVVIECKYEPSKQRPDFAVGRPKQPVGLWDRQGVLDDIRRVTRVVVAGQARAGYALFLDEGGGFRHCSASPMSTWLDWRSDQANVSVLLTRVDPTNSRVARQWLSDAVS
jgi:uncharacterized protein YuzE